MFDVQTYSLFLATALVIVLSPGPDTVLILSRTLASGTSAGLQTLVGSQLGNVIHALLAGIGVSTVVLFFPLAFNLLKFLGVAYLVYLAVQAWRVPGVLKLEENLDRRRKSSAQYFVQGLFNNLANPKMIVFFLALFPQFVRPESGPLAIQSLILGGTLAAIAILWLGVLVIAIGRVRRVVAANPGFITLANRLAALTFLGLACRLALEERR